MPKNKLNNIFKNKLFKIITSLKKDKEKKETQKIIGNKRRRLIYIILILFLSVFIIAQILLLYFANPILKSTIKNIVYNESKGLYLCDFKKIRHRTR